MITTILNLYKTTRVFIEAWLDSSRDGCGILSIPGCCEGLHEGLHEGEGELGSETQGETFGG